MFQIKLQPGVAVGIDQGVQASALLAVGAVLVVVAFVIGQVVLGEDAVDLLAADLIGHGVQGRNAHDLAAVVTDGLDALLGGIAGGAGSHQHQHMLVADHGLDVVTEEHLVVDAEFRLHNINGLVGVQAVEAVLAQLICQAGADDCGAVQTQDGIHRGTAPVKSSHQLLCNFPSLTQTALGIGNINIIVNVAMVGRKMTLGHPEGNIAALNGKSAGFDHKSYPPCHEISKSVFPPGQSVFAGM